MATFPVTPRSTAPAILSDIALAELAAWVDDIADDFEAAWQRGTPPSLESYLAGATGAWRIALLRELVRVDIAYRARRGEYRQIEDYLRDYPELTSADPEAPETARTDAPRTEFPEVQGYEILSELGRGGMGVVYLARQVDLNRVVALKMILSGAYAGPEARARFRAEAEAAARLQHPGIVSLYAVGEQEGRPYCVMEYVPGGSLAQSLAGTPRPARWAAALVESLARAVQYAHDHRIVHRDLKPANILLVSGGVVSGEWSGSGAATTTHHSPLITPKIADFGLAKQLNGADSPAVAETPSGEILGTPSYMAPEQAEGKRQAISPAVDIYALGAILYELLTGRPPFRGASALETLEQVRSQEPVSPSRLQPRLPRDLVTICLKALAKAPARRYPRAGDLADDLRRFLEGRPIHARPVSVREKWWRWCRRNPGVAVLAAAVVLLVLGGFAGVTWQWWRAEANRQQAEEARQRAEDTAEANRRLLYAANVKLAHQAWRNADLQRMTELLERDIPRAGQEDLREFAWYYLWRLRHTERAQLLGHTDEVHSVTYSPDGTRLATGSKDATVRIWDATTGRTIATLHGHRNEVNRVTFSPDGRTLASASDDGTVKLWEVATGREQATLTGHQGEVTAVAFAPDGHLLASGGQDRLIRLWDVQTRTQRQSLRGHTHRIQSLAFAPDGRTLASASRDGTAKLWNLAQEREPLTLAHPQWVRAVTFSHDGTRLATADNDHMVRLWNVTTGDEVQQFQGHTSGVHAVAFAPDDRTLASAGLDATVRVWDAATREERNLLRGHVGRVWGLAFAPDGRTLASAGADGTVKLWNPAQRPEMVSFDEPSGIVATLAVSPDEALLAVWTDRGVLVRRWQEAPGQGAFVPGEVIATLGRASWTYHALDFAPDSQTLALGGDDGKVLLWNPIRQQQRLLMAKDAGVIESVAFCPPDGRFLAVAHGNGEVTLWEVATGARHAVLRGHTSTVKGLAFAPDGQTLATSSHDSFLKLWDVATGQERDATPRRHRGAIHDVAFAPDGQTLATVSDDRTVKLWDAATGRERTTLFGHRDQVMSVAYAPNSRTLATRSKDGTIRLWDVRTGQELLTLEGDPDPNCALAFAPDGKTLLSGGQSAQGTSVIRLWRAAADAPSFRAR
jgi:WD40 repeat protein/serine/threonine protein kinase